MGEVGNVLEKPLHRLARACLKVRGENTFFSFIESLNSALEGLEENVYLAILSSSVNFKVGFLIGTKVSTLDLFFLSESIACLEERICHHGVVSCVEIPTFEEKGRNSSEGGRE